MNIGTMNDLQSKDSRLNRKWKWSRTAVGYAEEETKKWKHFQCSHARLGDWEMEAIQWSDYYEARINYVGNVIVHQDGFKTRIDAQIGAEKLLKTWIKQQLRTVSTGEHRR